MLLKPIVNKIKIDPISDRKYSVNLDHVALRENISKVLSLPNNGKVEPSQLLVDNIFDRIIDYVVTVKFIEQYGDTMDSDPYSVYIKDVNTEYLVTISSVKELNNDVIFGSNIIE